MVIKLKKGAKGKLKINVTAIYPPPHTSDPIFSSLSVSLDNGCRKTTPPTQRPSREMVTSPCVM